jgi:hypothetical protein
MIPAAVALRSMVAERAGRVEDGRGGAGMTGVELILAALAAGAGAGTADAAKAAVLDAYTGLRDALRNRLTGRDRAQQPLDSAQSEPGVWQADLGPQLEQSGAAGDEEILAAARRLLALTDPDGTVAGKYRIDATSAGHVHVGDTTIDAPQNQGAVGTFHAPVTFGVPPVPPATPGAS